LKERRRRESCLRYEIFFPSFYSPPPPSSSLLSGQKVKLAFFCGFLLEEVLETQYQSSKFLRVRKAYVGAACVKIQRAFLPTGLSQECSNEEASVTP
jgi:hypothetical protein